MAEVKVKVTAQNEVRTGLQQALRETQQFGQQAKRAVGQAVQVDDGLGPLREQLAQVRRLREQIRAPITSADLGPQEQDDGAATTSVRASSAIRGLAVDLANASSPAQVFEAILNRTTTALGGLVAATGGFAFGTIIRRSLEEAAQGLNDIIDQSQKLQTSFTGLLAPTTTFDQLSSAIRTAASDIEALGEANRKLQSGFGFQLADYLSTYDLSTSANRQTEQGQNNARLALATSIASFTARELAIAEARTDEERKLIALQANREELLAAAAKVSPEAATRLTGLFSAQDRTAAQDLERSLEDQAAKQRAINAENRRSLEDRLARERQGLADLEQFGGAGVDLQREQTVARIAELEKQISNEKERAANEAQREAEQRENAIKRDTASLAALRRASQSPEERRAALETEQSALANRAASLAPDDFAGRADVISEAQRIASEMAGLSAPAAGSSGASSLQRVGLASNEFFDTRRAEDPAKETKRAADFARQILQILQKGEPLVLPSTSS